MKTLAIIQARMGSTRLPGKVLLSLPKNSEKTVLEQVVQRVRAAKFADEVVVATSILTQDDAIELEAKRLNVACFRGSETDVLSRFFECAKTFSADNIVRITADCPAIDPELIDECIRLHLKESADYTTNTHEPLHYPTGLDVEVITFAALEAAYNEATTTYDREHVTTYLYEGDESKKRFKIAVLPAPDLYAKIGLRLTLDTTEDFERLDKLFRTKVLIFTEGGANIGFGHIARCSAIYSALKLFGLSPEFIVKGDESVSGVLKAKEWQLYDWRDTSKLESLLKDGCGIAVVDSYLASKEIYAAIANKSTKTLFFDDNMRLDYPDGTVLNSAILANTLPYSQNDNDYLLGAEYATLRREFWGAQDRQINEQIKTMLITFGGDDLRNLTPKVATALKEAFPDMVLKIVVAKGFKNSMEIKPLKSRFCELVYTPDAYQMKELMNEADICICASGQTLYELACLGTPTLCITVAENQTLNAKGFSDSRFCKYIGNWDDKKLVEKIVAAIAALQCNDKRQAASKSGQSLVDGLGAIRVVKRIFESDFLSESCLTHLSV